MANSTRLRRALDAPLFYGTCGTSSHCVPITTPGAESTNNLTRARRLGPRWQGQRQDPRHELSMRGDAAPSRQALLPKRRSHSVTSSVSSGKTSFGPATQV